MAEEKKQALIFGMNGAISGALAKNLAERYVITGIGREIASAKQACFHKQLVTDYSEPSLSELSRSLIEQQLTFNLIINTIGILHTDNLKPEKRLDSLSRQSLDQYFHVNTIIPGLLLKHFHSLLPKQTSSVFAHLSAKVGSIGDNRLGGWYGYRASKAALNMLVKTAAIEIARSYKHTAIVVIHPGTTIGPLSAPYTTNTPHDKLYTADVTAKRITRVIDNLSASDTGCFFDWSGETLPW